VTGGTNANPTIDPKDRIADVETLRKLAPDDVASMQQLLARNPYWSDLRDQLGAAYDRGGDHDKAAKTFADGIAATPRLAPQFAMSAASSLLDAHQIDGAFAHAQFAASHDAPGAHLLLGEIALARNDLASAASEAQIAEREASDRPRAIFLEAKIAAAKRDYATTLSLLEKARNAAQQTNASLPPRFHYVAGDALAHAGRFDDAMKEMDAEIASDPHDVQAYADRALLDVMHGDRVHAVATLEAMAAANRSKRVLEFGAATLEKWGDHADAQKWRARSRVAE